MDLDQAHIFDCAHLARITTVDVNNSRLRHRKRTKNADLEGGGRHVM
jgi:hypothetical protein